MSGSISPWPVVKSGSHGHPIKTLQYLLRARGQSVAVDGVFGPDTAAAVKAFQTSHGLTADGIVGPVTWAALVVQVKKGSRGDAVRGCKRSSSSATCPAIRARVPKSMGSSDRRQTRRCVAFSKPFRSTFLP
jgi:peptidoglycan hydrolase-like protein with peptidoglycan-binding domain